MNTTDPKPNQPQPVLYIIESKGAGAWSTKSAAVADKHRAKPDSFVTDYYSKVPQ